MDDISAFPYMCREIPKCVSAMLPYAVIVVSPWRAPNNKNKKVTGLMMFSSYLWCKEEKSTKSIGELSPFNGRRHSRCGCVVELQALGGGLT